MKSDKNKIQKKMADIIDRLGNKGIRPEDIAATLHVCYSSVHNWKTGRRHPKVSTIRQIEYLYGVKIL